MYAQTNSLHSSHSKSRCTTQLPLQFNSRITFRLTFRSHQISFDDRRYVLSLRGNALLLIFRSVERSTAIIICAKNHTKNTHNYHFVVSIESKENAVSRAVARPTCTKANVVLNLAPAVRIVLAAPLLLQIVFIYSMCRTMSIFHYKNSE